MSLDTLVKNKLIVYWRVYFSTLYSIPMFYMSVVMPVPNYFDYYSFLVSFKIKSVRVSLLIFIKIVYGLLWVSCGFGDGF